MKNLIFCIRKEDGKMRIFKDPLKAKATFWRTQNDVWEYYDIKVPASVCEAVSELADLIPVKR